MASFLGKFALKLYKEAQKTALDYNKQIFGYLGTSYAFPKAGDDKFISDGYQSNPTIYAIINLVAKHASTVPFQIYEVSNKDELKRYKSMTSGVVDANTMVKAAMTKKRALVELQDTELHELLERPNPRQSYSTWLNEHLGFSMLTGNSYTLGISNLTGKKRIKELYQLPAHNMEIIAGNITAPVRGYRTKFYNKGEIIEPDMICHIKDFNPDYDNTGSHLYGQSPLLAGFRSMTGNNEALKTGVSQLKNQMSRGILTAKQGDLNEAQAAALKGAIKKGIATEDILIAANELSWTNFGLSAVDLSLIDQQKLTQKDLCNIYNVPVQLLNNTDTSTYNNVKEAKKALYQNAVIPRLIQLRDELNRWLIKSYGENLYLDFDFSAVPELQEDLDKLVTQLNTAWWITPNEKRVAMNYDEHENEKMNEIHAPVNLQSLDDEPFGGEL